MNPTLKQIVRSKVGDKLPPSAKFLHYSGGDFFHEVDVQDVHLIERAEKKTRAKYKPVYLKTSSTVAAVQDYDMEIHSVVERFPEKWQESGYVKTVQWIFETKVLSRVRGLKAMSYVEYARFRKAGYSDDQVREVIEGINNYKSAEYAVLGKTVDNWLLKRTPKTKIAAI